MRQILGWVEATDSLSVGKNCAEETTWWRVAVLPADCISRSSNGVLNGSSSCGRWGRSLLFNVRELSQLARTGIEVVNGVAFGLNLLP